MVPLYSDLLLHDMGSASMTAWSKVKHAERIAHDPAVGSWRAGSFLARRPSHNATAAIMAHDGEAAPAAKTFLDLPPQQQIQLFEFPSVALSGVPAEGRGNPRLDPCKDEWSNYLFPSDRRSRCGLE